MFKLNPTFSRWATLCALACLFLFSVTAQAVGTDDFYGVMFSYGEDVTKATPKLNDLGVRWTRVWVNIKDWNTPANNTGSAAYDNGYNQAVALKNAGFKVILEINTEGGVVPTYSQAKAVYEWMLTKSNLKTSVDIWEIFNELNNKEYYNLAYSTTLTRQQQAQQYVNGPLKAAWDVFHVNNAEKVLGGSWTLWQQSAEYSTTGSYNLNLTKAYVDNGYLNYCDYAGIHPYHENTAGQQSFMTSAKALFGTKPIIVSEWGFKTSTYSTVTSYTNAMDANRQFMDDNTYISCYYRFTPGNGWYGLVGSASSNYPPVEPAYTTYKNWPKAGGSGTAYEVENEYIYVSGAAYETIVDTQASGGEWVVLNADATGDFIQFDLPNVPAGTFTVYVRFKKHASRGKYNLAIDGSSQGSTVDQYASTASYAEVSMGTKTFSSAALRKFKFTVAGKHASSTGYSLSVDRIRLVPSSARVSYEAQTLASSRQSPLTVYPNPGKGLFNLSIPGAAASTSATVFVRDALGRTVWRQSFGASQESPLSVDVQHLSGGTYLLEYTSGGKRFTQRLIKTD